MNNGAGAPLKCPGFGDLPVYHEIDLVEGFNDGAAGWEQTPRLTARELAMLSIMNHVTDTKDWHLNIFDVEKVEEWRHDASFSALDFTIDEHRMTEWGEKTGPAMPLVSEKTWEWCLAELKDKAVAFHDKQFLRVLDAGSCVCKSDGLVSTDTAEGFKVTVAQLRSGIKGQTAQVDRISDLVDPSMYPLVYGRTEYFAGGQQVALENCVETCFSPDTNTALIQPEPTVSEEEATSHPPWHLWGKKSDANSYKYSSQFQWLPCETKYTSNAEDPLRITSYINNLHPMHNKSLYRLIERIIAPAIRMWESCLFKGNGLPTDGSVGVAPIRIRTYGHVYTANPPWLDTVSQDMRDLWEAGTAGDIQLGEESDSCLWRIYHFLARNPSYDNENINRLLPEWALDRITNIRSMTFQTWAESLTTSEKFFSLIPLLEKKRDIITSLSDPEPGTAFSYEAWREGRNGQVIVGSPNYKRNRRMPSKDPDPDNGIQIVDLQDIFHKKGLQIIVRIREINLTAAEPTFTDDLTLEAQRNEHIVSTAAYVYSVTNVTTPRLSFHQPTSMSCEECHFGESGNEFYDNDAWDTHRRVFGFTQTEETKARYNPEQPYASTWEWVYHTPPLQTLGSVSLPVNRLLTWPNTLQHRLDGLALVDETQPGTFGMLIIYLVDPNYRICSTANVPPQQHDWWAEVALDQTFFGKDASLGARSLPPEVRKIVEGFTEGWLMGDEKAKEIKSWVEEDRAQALRVTRLGKQSEEFDPHFILYGPY
ncbi:hypothetical protein GLAREA_08655 [Glarea lozoyensis ATCC 20868]|uniref:Uncharacterized protein n=1 Tax=Glarea lozoyensis (strain ATCC 20868 / MF5171) TaxID=1116229 RepID=S3DDI7_GLAL2|nr:uncharacterized protein GLAREA_08655 [Glarea lozoyensis ATCC 20868]EPE36492.1 hypothetical protein GLAREA_08655 [Glarea lozoyensis ATCC 20868]